MLALAGFIALHSYSVSGRGLSWINTSSFDASVRFSEMVGSDISSIKRLAVLQNAFEDSGELDGEKLIISAGTVNGSIAYTVDDVISIGKTFGYTLDQSTHELVYNKPADEPNNYQVRVSYKTYDPYYFDNIEPGPSQGVMTVKDMCIEALRAVSDYYELKGIYGTEESNFRYAAYFVSNDGDDVTVGNSGDTGLHIDEFERYLTVNDRLDINTNIEPNPSNIMPDGRTFQYAETDGDVLEIGVDTKYLYNDRYKQAAAEYNAYIRHAYYWLTAFVIGVLAAVITLVPVVRVQDETGSRRHAIDRLPIEGMLLVLAFTAVLVYGLFRAALYNFLEVLIAEDSWGFWCSTAKMLDIYVFFVAALCSLYRRSCSGGIFADSLTGKAIIAIGREDGAGIFSTLAPYAAYIAVNALCIGGGVWCMSNSILNRYYYFAAVMLFAAAAAADIYVYLSVYRRNRQRGEINDALKRISSGDVGYALDEKGFSGGELDAARSINSISDGLKTALNEQVKADRLKADLITNVSHDIKTPLTSIINYVDLIKRENIDNERVREYIDILDKKSSRLKNLTEDLVEASKASSGNIKLEMCRLDMAELAVQAGGEFDDKFAARRLEFNLNTGDGQALVWADGRHLWRVFENLYNNAAKYAMENTRIYADVSCTNGSCVFSIKNVSQNRLNISPDELTERFIRGDVSRSTEGSGLGLNIAQSLTRLMGGELIIEIDGDLYKAKVVLPAYAGQGEHKDNKEEEQDKA